MLVILKFQTLSNDFILKISDDFLYVDGRHHWRSNTERYASKCKNNSDIHKEQLSHESVIDFRKRVEVASLCASHPLNLTPPVPYLPRPHTFHFSFLLHVTLESRGFQKCVQWPFVCILLFVMCGLRRLCCIIIKHICIFMLGKRGFTQFSAFSTVTYYDGNDGKWDTGNVGQYVRD